MKRLLNNLFPMASGGGESLPSLVSSPSSTGELLHLLAWVALVKGSGAQNNTERYKRGGNCWEEGRLVEVSGVKKGILCAYAYSICVCARIVKEHIHLKTSPQANFYSPSDPSPPCPRVGLMDSKISFTHVPDCFPLLSIMTLMQLSQLYNIMADHNKTAGSSI